jgi:hypothetical protein
MNIQQQIEDNRKLIQALPVYLKLVNVWNPETLSHEKKAVEFHIHNLDDLF